MNQYKEYFAKHVPDWTYINKAFETDEALQDAMYLFIENAKPMQANFDNPSIIYKDISHQKLSNTHPQFFKIYDETPKLMPRKGRFYLNDGQMEFVYENREFDALNGETHEYSGPGYLNWYKNDEVEHNIYMEVFEFETITRNFLLHLFEELYGPDFREELPMALLGSKIMENKILKDATFYLSGDLIYEMASEFSQQKSNPISSVYANAEFSKKLEETSDNLSPIISVINTALVYLASVYHRLYDNMEQDFDIIRTGREGEEKVIKEVEKLDYFSKMEGYTIAYGDDSFESDVILLNEQGIHLLEVKNYGSLSKNNQSFEITQEGDMHFYINGHRAEERRSPVNQVLRHKKIMEQMLHEQGHDIPVYAYVVMANDYLSFVNHSSVPVLSLYQIEKALQSGPSSLKQKQAQEMIHMIETYKREEKRFPIFNYLKVFEEITQELVENTARFLQKEMYTKLDQESFIAVSLFGDFVTSNMLYELGDEGRRALLSQVDDRSYLVPIEKKIDTMNPTEKLGFFMFPSLLNFMENRKKRLFFATLYLFASLFLIFKGGSRFFQYGYDGGFLSSLPAFISSVFTTTFIWQNIASMFLILYLVSGEKTENYIIQLSQSDYPFWKGTLAEKVANFLKLNSYRADEHGDFSRKATFRYYKFSKLRILIVFYDIVLFAFFYFIPPARFLYFVVMFLLSGKAIMKNLSPESVVDKQIPA